MAHVRDPQEFIDMIHAALQAGLERLGGESDLIVTIEGDSHSCEMVVHDDTHQIVISSDDVEIGP